MAAVQPLYTPAKCKFAYQLRWAITIHWRQTVDESVWLEPLQNALEKDQINILSIHQPLVQSTPFALSTRPAQRPIFIIQRLKGRLQYAVRDRYPKALQTHYAIRSFGTQERQVIEAYIAKQPMKHTMAAERFQKIFEDLLYSDTSVDLSLARSTEHATYWYNLQFVLVHQERWSTTHDSSTRPTRKSTNLARS